MISVDTPEAILTQNIQYWRKSKKTGIVFVDKFNEVNVKYRFLILRSHENLYIVIFASNTFSGRPPVLHKQFWNKIEDIGGNQKNRECFCR